MSTSQELKKAAAETASAAAEYSTAALKDGLDRAQALLTEAQKQAGPALKDAKIRTADFAAKRLDDIEPHLKEALEKVTPAVESAKEHVTDSLLPKLQDALHQAAEHPAVAEAAKHASAAVEAVSAEVVPAKKKSKGRSFFKFLAIGAAVAGAVAAVRHFLSPKDDGWTAHEPSKAYVNNNDTFSNAAKFASDLDSPAEPAPAEEQAAAAEHEASPNPYADVRSPEDLVVTEAEAEEQNDMTSEGAPAPEGNLKVVDSYGEGSYVGSEPPAEFIIKGNERSKKYHLPGTGGYDRTIAEVWFNSEEAAQQAGFTKAQR